MIIHYDIDFWPLTFEINGVHPLIMVNKSKFDIESHNGSFFIVFTSLFPNMSIVPRPLTSKIIRIHPLTMDNISAKFDE